MSRLLRSKLLALAAAALCGALPARAAAQATVTGQVRDAVTNAPVPGAVVAIVELRRAAQTDSAGIFVIPGLAAGTYRWSIVRLGYVPLEQQMDLRDGDHFRVGVMPRPAAPGTVAVAENRAAEHFRRRMSAALTAVRLLTGEALTEGDAETADQAVVRRIELRPCPASVPVDPGMDCVAARGRVQRVSVFIDELPVPGGVFELSAFRPEELYAVEIWNGGAEIRAFTHRFVSEMAAGRAQFAPRE